MGVVLEAVRERGLALRFAPSEMQCNREVALAAVRRDPDALSYVAESLRADRDIVCAAVASGGLDTFFSAIEKDGLENGEKDALGAEEWHGLDDGEEEVEEERDSLDDGEEEAVGGDSSSSCIDAVGVATSDVYECCAVELCDISHSEAVESAHA